MIKTLTTLTSLMMLTLTLSAQSFSEWQDQKVNQISRVPSHTHFFAYESPEAAAVADKTQSTRYMSLDGDWSFAWVADADQRPTDFFRTDYNDAHWGVMPVPGIWEKHGYGEPLYVNAGYAWKQQYDNNPPYVPTKNNHVGSYRRWIDIPQDWKGENVIAHFGSVTSNIYLWVNGKFVGYSEDSKVAAEFDITPYIKPGRNLFAMQVFRWCDGSYFEDQDFFRFSGIARESYLYSRNPKHISDIRFNARLDASYQFGTLDMQIYANSNELTAEVELSLQGKRIASQSVKLSSQVNSLSLNAGKVLAWTAETPNLYDVTTTLRDSKGSILEVIPLKAGFRDVRIEDGLLKVNGKAILVKGVNRHEMDPDGGYVLSYERMIEDLKLIKAYNFNAVRTSHYPNDPRWYDLCDQYGIYLVGEANIESHGMGYGDKSLAKFPAFKQTHIERNEHNVKTCYNHPSIIIWSLGNEAGDGVNFDAAYDWVKAFDSSRPVQYERALSGRNTDIYCPMYNYPDASERYCQRNPNMPLIQCEYAHAMGNSLGGFKEYWDLIRKYPHYQGGFIWDMIDQSQRKANLDGKVVYGYGGDWNPYDASDVNFCNNGLISPDRVAHPELNEVRYQQQSIWSKLLEDKQIEVYNEFDFKSLADVELRWELLSDGRVIRTGTVSELAVEPGQKGRIDINYGQLPCEGEVLLNLHYHTKSAEGVLNAGHRIAYQQLTLREWKQSELSIKTLMRDKFHSAGELRIVQDDKRFVILESPLLRVDFSRQSGLITRYDVRGRKILADAAVIEPDFWRAPTDNDFGAWLNVKNRVWEKPGLALKSLDSKIEDGVAKVVAQYELTQVGGALTIEYRINNAGEIAVKQSLKAGERTDVPDLMRFGMRMALRSDNDRVAFYGRGPWENYVDRKSSAVLGIYEQSVAEQYYPYIRPQETGLKSDCRYFKLENVSHRGVKIEGAKPFYASALNYSREMLDEGWEKRQLHNSDVAPCAEVWLTISGYEYGLGCIDSWGALPYEEYRLPYKDYEFEFAIRPY